MSFALVALGGFLLAVGILAQTYAYPRVAVIPVDLDSAVVAQNPPGEPGRHAHDPIPA